jgi:hypothetical protein
MLRHLEQLIDAFDPILIPGLLYLPVRGWKHLRGKRFAIAVPLVLCLSYIILFSLAAGGWVQERYYRPIIPFAAILAAMGYYCMGKDMARKAIIYPLICLVLAACLWDGMEEPIREHRRPQTIAGKWLRQYDPTYDGFVISDNTQPVFYAGMKYFDPACQRSLFLDLQRAGYRFKYIILDGDEEDKWYAQYARHNNWNLIYAEQERDIRIYQSPMSD